MTRGQNDSSDRGGKTAAAPANRRIHYPEGRQRRFLNLQLPTAVWSREML